MKKIIVIVIVVIVALLSIVFVLKSQQKVDDKPNDIILEDAGSFKYPKGVERIKFNTDEFEANKEFEADIDNDNVNEKITFSYGFTSGIYTFILSAVKEGSEVYYYNIFAPMIVKDDFVMKNGKPYYVTIDENNKAEYYLINVKDGNIFLGDDDKYVDIWGAGKDPILQKALVHGNLDDNFFNEESRFGINIWIEEASKDSLKVKYIQNKTYGDGRKTPNYKITTGNEYFLEVLTENGKWKKLKSENDIFNMIGYVVSKDIEGEENINLSFRYPNLKNSYISGLYRLGKYFTVVDGSDTNQKVLVYAYFSITD